MEEGLEGLRRLHVDFAEKTQNDLKAVDKATRVRFKILCELILRCMNQLHPMSDRFVNSLRTFAEHDTELEELIGRWSRIYNAPSAKPILHHIQTIYTDVQDVVTSLDSHNKTRDDERTTLLEKLDVVEQYIKYVGQDLVAIRTQLQSAVDAQLLRVDKELQSLVDEKTPCSEIPRRKFQTCRARADCLYEKGKGCRDAKATTSS